MKCVIGSGGGDIVQCIGGGGCYSTWEGRLESKEEDRKIKIEEKCNLTKK